MIVLKILKKERTGQIKLQSDLQQMERKRMNQVTLSLCFSKIWFNNFVSIFLDNYTETEKEDNDDNENSSNGSQNRKSDLF